ncbi:hypothetical protein [Haloarchaeobius sp. DFWS5]|uniref:hypothetical protein n=1 Tax=Haloarchaeobius sp. DFWS5 TaxID=3446114 RepID=UPI003EBF8ED6
MSWLKIYKRLVGILAISFGVVGSILVTAILLATDDNSVLGGGALCLCVLCVIIGIARLKENTDAIRKVVILGALVIASLGVWVILTTQNFLFGVWVTSMGLVLAFFGLRAVVRD